MKIFDLIESLERLKKKKLLCLKNWLLCNLNGARKFQRGGEPTAPRSQEQTNCSN